MRIPSHSPPFPFSDDTPIKLEKEPGFEDRQCDIAGAVAAITESDPTVESERASHNTPG